MIIITPHPLYNFDLIMFKDRFSADLTAKSETVPLFPAYQRKYNDMKTMDRVTALWQLCI